LISESNKKRKDEIENKDVYEETEKSGKRTETVEKDFI